MGDVVQVLEVGHDAEMNIERFKCRVFSDGIEGWVSPTSNQGTPYLETVMKPFYSCNQSSRLTSALDTASGTLEDHDVVPGEIFELFEGPRTAPTVEVERVKGKASTDGKIGWVTVVDAAGIKFLDATVEFVCAQSVALTDSLDVTESKAIRKLDAGEKLIPQGEETVDAASNLVRLKVKTAKDDKEGWVTVKGGKGTMFVEKQAKRYECVLDTAMEMRMPTGSGVLRVLAKGETLEVLEGPKPFKIVGAQRIRGRSVSSKCGGWLTITDKNLSSWKLGYKCVKNVELRTGSDSASDIIRELEVGEKVRALETPTKDAGSGYFKVRVLAAKDNATGFVNIRGEADAVFLEPST